MKKLLAVLLVLTAACAKGVTEPAPVVTPPTTPPPTTTVGSHLSLSFGTTSDSVLVSTSDSNVNVTVTVTDSSQTKQAVMEIEMPRVAALDSNVTCAFGVTADSIYMAHYTGPTAQLNVTLNNAPAGTWVRWVSNNGEAILVTASGFKVRVVPHNCGSSRLGGAATMIAELMQADSSPFNPGVTAAATFATITTDTPVPSDSIPPDTGTVTPPDTTVVPPPADTTVVPPTDTTTVPPTDTTTTPPPPPTPVASVTMDRLFVDTLYTSGATLQLVATPKDANGNTLSGRTITWSSSGPTATVNGNGLITTVGAGVVVITAASEGKSAITQITVFSGALPNAAVWHFWAVATFPDKTCQWVGTLHDLTTTAVQDIHLDGSFTCIFSDNTLTTVSGYKIANGYKAWPILGDTASFTLTTALGLYTFTGTLAGTNWFGTTTHWSGTFTGSDPNMTNAVWTGDHQ